MREGTDTSTSKTSNLAVLTLDHVFFSRATGLRFMPAEGTMSRGQGMERQVAQASPPGPGYSHMMAIMELKFPMLKHSRATSMKNSSMRVRCFFFTTWKQSLPRHGATKGPLGKSAGRASDLAAGDLRSHLQGTRSTS